MQEEKVRVKRSVLQRYISEKYSGLCQTSKMSFLWKLLTAERKRIPQNKFWHDRV